MKRFFPLQAQTVDKGHGRLEVRTIATTPALNGYLDFPHVAQVAKVTRAVTHLCRGKATTETVYLLTSLSSEKAPPDALLALNRDAWSIENKSHYVRDVTYDEDRSQVRTKKAPRVMASVRNAAIGLLRLAGFKAIPGGNRYCAHHRDRTLDLLGL